MGFLRIIAGELGGRRIRAPRDARVRPTADRVREALFSILGARVQGARVLDAFAGTGALGLEALSRGALQVVFVELAPVTLRLLQGNIDALGLGERSEVLRGDAVAVLSRRLVRPPFDLILADPPYESPAAERFLAAVGTGEWLVDGGRLVLERPVSATRPQAPPGLKHDRSARYGQTRLDFYSP